MKYLATLAIATLALAGCTVAVKAPEIVGPAPASYASPTAAVIPLASPAPPSGQPASVAPSPPAAQVAPVKFESDGTKKGVQGPFRLDAGKWTLKATHAGTGNFIVSLKPAKPGGFPKGAFNEIGAGAWEWSTLIDDPGDYYLDVTLADGAWTLTAD